MTAALFACLLSASAFAPNPNLALYIEQQAKANAVPLEIAEAIIWQESRWNPFATRHNPNGTTDQGLWQLNSQTAKWLSLRYNGGRPINPFNPYESTRVALRYLGELYTVTGGWRVAIAAYNAGIGAVWADDVPQSTVYYVRSVVAAASM